MFYVYVLRSKKTQLRYVGQTGNIEKRLFAHNNGLSKFTKNRGPWILLHLEKYETRSGAINREKFLKSGKGREFLDNLTK